MQHSGDACAACIRHERPGIVLCVAGVHDYGESGVGGEGQLGCERAPLLVARRVVVMIVEAAFANSHRARFRKRPELGTVHRRMEPARVVRMHPRRVPQEAAVAACQRPAGASGAEDVPGAAAGADADDRVGTALPRALYYVAAVAAERLV